MSDSSETVVLPGFEPGQAEPKLQCYHYTIRQSSMLQSLATIPPGIMRTLKANAKLRFFPTYPNQFPDYMS